MCGRGRKGPSVDSRKQWERTQAVFVEVARRFQWPTEKVRLRDLAKQQATGVDAMAALRPSPATPAVAERNQPAQRAVLAWRQSVEAAKAILAAKGTPAPPAPHPREPPLAVAATPQALRRAQGEADEKTLNDLVTARAPAFVQRAQRLQTRLHQLEEVARRRLRAHEANKPIAPRGWAALMGGQAKHAASMDTWAAQDRRLERRLVYVNRRLNKVGAYAENRFNQGEVLALTKIKREEPELWRRVDSFREAQRQERLATLRQEREAAEKTRNSDRDLGWSR